MSLTHEQQKERARQEAEHHAEHSTVDGMRSSSRHMQSRGEAVAHDAINDRNEAAGNKEELLTNTP